MESQFSIKDINLLINSCCGYRSHLKWLIGRMTQPCSQTLLNSWDAKGQFSWIYIGKSLLASGGDLQQGGCLYKPTSGIQWTPEHLWMSDRPQKPASAKADLSTFGSGVLTIS